MLPRVSRTIRNYQTTYLAGMMSHCSNADLAENGFRDALRTVAEVSAVGLVERYDETMVLPEECLGADFGDVDLAYLPQNVRDTSISSEEEKVASVLAELGDLSKRVIDENSYDLALYQLARQQFDARLAAIANFAEKLENFHARCAALRA